MVAHPLQGASADSADVPPSFLRQLRRLAGGARRGLRRLPFEAADRGLPPAWFGYRWVAQDTVAEYLARSGARGSYRTIHPEAIARNPLPCNVGSRDELPSERGWWGYSFHDVPERTSGETFIATVPDCRIVSFIEPAKRNFYPCIVTGNDRALYLREIAFRAGHGEPLRSDATPLRMKKATWFLERVYHNHSHWLTAHLPKLRLLQEQGGLGHLLMPQNPSAAMNSSLRMLGLDLRDFPTYDPDRPLEVEELTVVGTDRFRPELLQPVREAVMQSVPVAGGAARRVFISRAKSKGRRLVNEEDIWPMLRNAGFERTFMEDLTLEEQVRLMQETAILLAPHGAGLTNMMFCRPGTHVIELADLGFPNPNFYALASAMGHSYWVVPSEALGDVHPLEKDLRADPTAIREVLERAEASLPDTPR
ncbi:MAG: glycosyltransferase family 61 protein [Rhodospirillaceae bacterium]